MLLRMSACGCTRGRKSGSRALCTVCDHLDACLSADVLILSVHGSSLDLSRRFLFSPLLCPTLFYIHLQSNWTKPDFPAEASGCSCICAPDHSQLREATGGLSTVHCAFTARPNSPSFWGNSLNDLVEVDGYLGLKIAYLKVFYRNIVDLLQCCVEVAYQFR